MCTITTSQVARKDIGVLFSRRDGAGLGPKTASYLQVCDIAAIIEGLFKKNLYVSKKCIVCFFM